jgi:DNA-binding SARP family transcriptional activator/TolB-like protein
MPVESEDKGDRTAALQVRLFGALTIRRDGAALALPASRKVRGLIAYLALAPHPVSRSQLCELLWDVPDDPRGELRWCLSKARRVLDEPQRRRVYTAADTIALDLSDCHVDAIEINRAAQEGIDTLDVERLRALEALFLADFLDGLEIDRNPAFGAWLTAQRRRFRGCRTAVLEHLVARAGDDEAPRHLEKWLELAPFDQRVHECLLRSLARRGAVREAEEHLAATARLFESEGVDAGALRAAWRSARAPAREPVRVLSVDPAPPAAAALELAPATSRRASIAVMPFVDRAAAPDPRGGSADALAHDVITRLAKLRSLFVIAQGTVFALHEREVGAEQAGRMLDVDFVVSGSLQRRGARIKVTVELTETRSARIVWTEIFNQKLDDAFEVLDEIGNRIVASVASEIELIERNRAILKPPSSLDAWEAHHRGLWHMYRFNRADNERAHHFFETAVRLDPTFSRAYAGLSFTHFQNAFQGWGKREPEIERAYQAAGQSLMADERDPAAHWAMGRSLWLRGAHEQGVVELERAIELSPNFAIGHYTLAFVHSQAGNAQVAIEYSDHSRKLSPFDPLLFGMLGARAMALVRLGRFEEAAEWALKAAARPNAHAHILAIAAYCLAMAARSDEAREHLAAIRRRQPGYRVDDFLAAMQFEPGAAELFRNAAKTLG